MVPVRHKHAWLAALAVIGLLGGLLAPLAVAQVSGAALADALATPRFDTSATLLTSGKILVAGGETGQRGSGNATASVELYDPAANSFSSAASLQSARGNALASLLPSGNVLLVGGTAAANGKGPAVASAELYDAAANTWSSAGSLKSARTNATATMLPDGRVLVAGGETAQGGGTALSSAEIYNPATNSWSDAGTMTATRVNASATLLADGRVLVVGGSTSDDPTSALTSAEIYSPATNSWSSAGDMTAARSSGSATMLSDGRVLAVGGDIGCNATASLYDPATNSWSSAAAPSSPHSGQTATRLPDGRVLIAGGEAGPGDTGNVLARAESYNPQTNSWTASNALSSGRAGTTATLLPNGQVVFIGGADATGAPVATVEQFTPPPLTTTTLPTAPPPAPTNTPAPAAPPAPQAPQAPPPPTATSTNTPIPPTPTNTPAPPPPGPPPATAAPATVAPATATVAPTPTNTPAPAAPAGPTSTPRPTPTTGPTATPTTVPTATPTPSPTPTPTSVPLAPTAVPPTPVPPSPNPNGTPLAPPLPTATPVPPTATPIPPTATPIPPTPTATPNLTPPALGVAPNTTGSGPVVNAAAVAWQASANAEVAIGSQTQAQAACTAVQPAGAPNTGGGGGQRRTTSPAAALLLLAGMVFSGGLLYLRQRRLSRR